MHGGKRQEVVVLLLRYKKCRDDGRALIIVRILGQQVLAPFMILRGELEWSFFRIYFSVSVVGKRTEVAGSDHRLTHD